MSHLGEFVAQEWPDVLGEKPVRRHVREVPERTDEEQVVPGPFGLSTETGGNASFSRITTTRR